MALKARLQNKSSKGIQGKLLTITQVRAALIGGSDERNHRRD